MSVRFAPSPTGDFHIGNLRTAWISWQWAQRLRMPWMVRFEDIDAPRVVAGAAERQLEQMAWLGLHANRVYRQSGRRERHWELFRLAIESGRVYPCFCSRKDLREALENAASAPHDEPPAYHGRCRAGKAPSGRSLPTIAWRFRAEKADGSRDLVVARTRSLEPDLESFVPAYQWACAIDDHDGRYSLLVRAWDLASSAAIQREIQAWMAEIAGEEARFPAIFHASLVVQDDGTRIEKRTRQARLTELRAAGLTAEIVRARFAASFGQDFTGFAPGKIFGEKLRTLPLRELDIKIS